MTTRRFASISGAALLMIAGAHGAPPPPAGPAMTLIDERLTAQPITLVSLDTTKDELVFIDADGKKQTRALTAVLALLPSDITPRASHSLGDMVTSQWLELADGQRFPGAFALADKADPKHPTVPWVSARLGKLSITLDLVARYVGAPALLAEATSKPLSTANDTVVTMNMDRIEGVLEELGRTITISPPLAKSKDSAESANTTVQSDQVALVNLFTKRTPATGPMLELVDGSVLATGDARFDRNALTFTVRAGEARAAPTRVLGSEIVSFTPRAERFVPLASLAIASQTFDTSRVFGENVRVDDSLLPAPAGLGDVHLPGPMTVEWSLPTGASGAAASIELEPDALTWGDCNIVITLFSGSDERVLDRGRLNAESSTRAFRADLGRIGAGARLKITIQPGANGAVQDRVVIRRGLVVVNSAPKR
jgi:hypothetical protein